MKLEYISPQNYINHNKEIKTNNRSTTRSPQTLTNIESQNSSTALKIAIIVGAALVRGSIYYAARNGGQHLGLSLFLSRGLSLTGGVIAGILTENFLNTITEKSTGIKLSSPINVEESHKSYNLLQHGISITSILALAILQNQLQLSQTATEAILIGALPVIRELQKTVDTP